MWGVVRSWGRLGGLYPSDLLCGLIRRLHRARLRLDLTCCRFALLVLGVTGVHFQLGFIVNVSLRFTRSTKSQIQLVTDHWQSEYLDSCVQLLPPVPEHPEACQYEIRDSCVPLVAPPLDGDAGSVAPCGGQTIAQDWNTELLPTSRHKPPCASCFDNLRGRRRCMDEEAAGCSLGTRRASLQWRNQQHSLRLSAFI